MAISNATFSDISGAVSDIFAGMGAADKAALQAQGLRITAQGTLITAQGTRLNAESLRTKAAGDIAEASNYDLASTLAEANKAYTDQSTRLQQSQLNRNITQTIGGQQAGVAASGFGAGGSAAYLLRDSQAQGALAKGVLAQQGVITEAGYEQQAQSYTTLANAGRATAAAEMDMASKTDTIATEQDALAVQQQQLANQTQDVGNKEADMDFFSGAIKGVSAIASIFI